MNIRVFREKKYFRENSKKGTFGNEKINMKIYFYASKVTGGRKYCENERVYNLLTINNKTFLDKLWGCN